MLLTKSKRLHFFILSWVLAAPLSAQEEIPQNLALGLRELVELHLARPAGMREMELRGKRLTTDATTGKRILVDTRESQMIVDRTNRVLVTVMLDGSLPLEDLRGEMTKLGLTVVAEEPEYRSGAISAYLPLRSAARLARTPGVSVVKLVHRPKYHTGSVTSQGVALLHADQVIAQGITGQGITIGILSDSYNQTLLAPTTAYDDVTTNDLPNVGVPDGRPGLKFLSDGFDDSGGAADEGRAMAQIVYDVAPGAQMCFASAALGEVAFATAIRRLRIDSGCAADILVDDTAYLDEPMFSDGLVAQAVNDVVSSTKLAGKPVAYFSAAGNQGESGYASDLRFVADPAARALTGQRVDLTTIPSFIDTTGGFHNFNPNATGTPAIAQQVNLQFLSETGTLANLSLQWDDPFDLQPSGITTQLNLLVFDASGKYVDIYSSYFNSFTGNVPIQFTQFDTSATYYFVIARTKRGSHLATKVRYVYFSFAHSIVGDYLSPSLPTLFGHATAQGAQAVGAYLYDNGAMNGQLTPELESTSGAGPTTISFDSTGKRLAAPVIRQKPDFAAPDCVTTTSFFQLDALDSFSFFCGTSAAAPHAAGVAALLLQSAGGPRSLTNDQIRKKLQASPAPRNLNPFASQATLAGGAATVTLTANGDDFSTLNSNFFTVVFNSSTAGQTLASLTIDLTPTGISFDPRASTGFPLTLDAATTPGVTITSPNPARGRKVTIAFSGFTAGGSASFGIGRVLVAGGNPNLGNGPDGYAALLAGATVTATLGGGSAATLTGTFANQIGSGYSPFDGFGLIDALAALKAP